MFELRAKNYKGEEIDLTGGAQFTVYKITGLTPPKATISSAAIVTSDGSKINSARVEERNIVLYLAIEGLIETNRRTLYKYFPVKKNVELFFKNNTADVHIEGMVESIECDLFKSGQTAQISILCPQPYFEAADEIIEQFCDIQAMFSFPFALPSEGAVISQLTASQRKSIFYEGDVATGMVINLFATGTVVNPIVYNVQTSEHIALNLTMQTSDEIIINTKPGEKSITRLRNGVSTNILGYLVPNSTWFTLEPGDNVFTYSTDSGTSNLQITITAPVLHGGV